MSIHLGGRGPGHIARVQGNRLPMDGSYTLLLDFVPDGADTDWINLNLVFTGNFYQANEADASVPSGTFINILAWS